jgi:alginate O-acetyltransferase complex protein AlgI
MAFTSYTYFAFLVFAVALVRLTRGKGREYALLGLSLVFYAAWDPRFLAVLLGLGIFTYFAGHAVVRYRGRGSITLVSVCLILLVLGIFKYSGMAIGALNLVLPARVRLPAPHIILPLGISFFTFECISYLIDVRKGGRELVPLSRFLLFPAFWPHMVAGPILRIKEFAPQVERPVDPSVSEMLGATDRIVIGVMKKVVLADSLAATVDQGFAADHVSCVDGWMLAFAFGLQIYFDFSAYTDIAIGSARLVGFSFPENFNLPYHAASPSDFWNRWHMTLSRWIRDYIFFPLNLRAGRRLWLRHLSLVFVMAVVGLWHGAGLSFVLWGVWHGCLMVGHRLLQPLAARTTAGAQKLLGFFGWLSTLMLVQAGWVLFRAPTLAQASRILGAMFSLRGRTPSYSPNDYLLVACSLLAYFAAEPLWGRLWRRIGRAETVTGRRFWLRPLAYALATQLLFMFDKSNVSFIYFQF